MSEYSYLPRYLAYGVMIRVPRQKQDMCTITDEAGRLLMVCLSQHSCSIKCKKPEQRRLHARPSGIWGLE